MTIFQLSAEFSGFWVPRFQKLHWFYGGSCAGVLPKYRRFPALPTPPTLRLEKLNINIKSMLELVWGLFHCVFYSGFHFFKAFLICLFYLNAPRKKISYLICETSKLCTACDCPWVYFFNTSRDIKTKKELGHPDNFCRTLSKKIQINYNIFILKNKDYLRVLFVCSKFC